MSDNFLTAVLSTLGEKPPEDADRVAKKTYSEQVSSKLAPALADELRRRGLKEARPGLPGDLDLSGAERRMAGGIGAKKVDVTWATEESGLLLGISIKTINFGNLQKNLINRRGDMLIESVTLHRRFPYAVLAGLLFLDKRAETDGKINAKGKTTRRSTFLNAHTRYKLFTGRDDPAGRDEQYERFYIGLMDANPFAPNVRIFLAGDPDNEVPIDTMFDDLIELIAERNSDFYEAASGRLLKVR